MATTSFQGGGYPGRPYGSFAGRVSVTTITIQIEDDDDISPAQVVAGGETIQITLTGGATWVTAPGFDDWKPTILSNFVSNQNEAQGWNLYFEGIIDSNNVTRDSDTQVSLTLPAGPLYAITIQEVISWVTETNAIDLNGTTLGSPNTWTITPVAVVDETPRPRPDDGPHHEGEYQKRRQRNIFKPTGLLDRPVPKGRKSVADRIEDSRQIHEEVRARGVEPVVDRVADQPVVLTQAQIDAEIATLLRKKWRTEEDDLMLMILMAASV